MSTNPPKIRHLRELYQTTIYFRRVKETLTPDTMGSCHALRKLHPEGPSFYQTSSRKRSRRLHQVSIGQA
ncbi:hypothetical protein SO802_004496 [Lithocarpus litseifolius]|uniref:Uncharacterized protein n=1 Tax=Lithocarpus litseifolius TaxID=425828 RepID=A0AAW2E3P1_9ROSI